MNKPIVSFDYDKTLSTFEVMEFAIELVNRGFDLHIVTARYSDANCHKYLNPIWREMKNEDLWRSVKQLGIPKENVHFTGFECKIPVIEELDALFHIDDDEMLLYDMELANIKTKPFSVLDKNWQANLINFLVENEY